MILTRHRYLGFSFDKGMELNPFTKVIYVLEIVYVYHMMLPDQTTKELRDCLGAAFTAFRNKFLKSCF